MSKHPKGPQRGQTEAPDDAGRQAVESCNWPLAERIARTRLRKRASDAFGLRYLGLALAGQGRVADGMQAYERALHILPRDAGVLINASNVASQIGQHQKAYEWAKRATQVAPGLARAWVTLLWPCYMTARHQEAVEAAQVARQLNPNPDELVLLLNNLSTNLRDLGRLDEALQACREAMAMAPQWPLPYINQMLFLQSRAATTDMELRAAAEQYAAQFEATQKPHWPSFATRNADPQRKLRVGFISPDFNMHPVMYFIEGVLPQLDRRCFEVHALYMQHLEDSVTQRVRRHVDHFHSVADMGDVPLMQFILGLEIDILIDLAGHTAGSPLGVMRFKPAPVQVTWLGFPGTTGLTAMDWRFTDAVGDPPGADAAYVERLWRLPDMFCVYRPMSRFPLYRYQPLYAVRPTPALHNGFITFGSCNNLSKITDPVLSAWAAVLDAVPNARLLVEGKGFEHETARAEFAQRAQALGLDVTRLDLIPRDTTQQYLTYHRIDIALDTFPLTGGTTTTDLLWMGVPLVSMQGVGFRSRISQTVLVHAGHPEWIAADVADYVRIARELAANVNELNTRRLAQRQQVEHSPVMDEARFVRHFASALRSMWHDWCARHDGTTDPAQIAQRCAEWAQTQLPEAPPQVTIAPSQVVTLQAAHQQLQALTAEALAQAGRDVILAGQTEPPPITHPAWLAVLAWCEYLLESIPNEPLALATLAEIEHAHGRTDFATTYLKYAQQALMRRPG